LYEQSFTYINQIYGIEEDRVNKPDRPLVKGTVTVREAVFSWILTMIAYSLVSYQWEVLSWSAVWQVTVLPYHVFDMAKHWLWRNAYMFVGYAVMLAASWRIIAEPDALTNYVTFMLPFATFLSIHVQDLRDQVGDLAVGRRTFPIVFGDVACRYSIIVAMLFVVIPFQWITLWFLPVHVGYIPASVLVIVFLSVYSAYVAFRVFFYRTVAGDRKTYHVYVFNFCLWQLAFLCVKKHVLLE
jgi:4-hydroxybenzoate polyprenyltransferase